MLKKDIDKYIENLKVVKHFSSHTLVNYQRDLDKLKSTKRCEKCVLNGVDLSLANLSEAYLRKVNLKGASFLGAKPVSYTHLTLPTKA